MKTKLILLVIFACAIAHAHVSDKAESVKQDTDLVNVNPGPNPKPKYNKDNPMDRIVDGDRAYLVRQGEDDGFLVFHVFIEGFKVKISLNEEDDFTVVDAKELTRGLHFLDRQLKDVKSAIPTKAFTLLQENVLIEYEDRRDGFPTYYSGSEPTIELWGLEYHRDILDGWIGAGNFGNPNIMLHELAHAWHDLFIPDGFDNQEVIDRYELALDSYETEDADGDEYYWATNEKEWFAEFSVMYFRSHWDEPNSKYEIWTRDTSFIKRMWGFEADEPH